MYEITDVGKMRDSGCGEVATGERRDDVISATCEENQWWASFCLFDPFFYQRIKNNFAAKSMSSIL